MSASSFTQPLVVGSGKKSKTNKGKITASTVSCDSMGVRRVVSCDSMGVM